MSPDVLRLLGPLLDAAGSPPHPATVALAALAVATVGWVGAIAQARLWNQTWHAQPAHHVACAAVAVVTAVALVAAPYAWYGARSADTLVDIAAAASLASEGDLAATDATALASALASGTLSVVGARLWRLFAIAVAALLVAQLAAFAGTTVSAIRAIRR